MLIISSKAFGRERVFAGEVSSGGTKFLLPGSMNASFTNRIARLA
jgi:hypothetical protein